MYLPSSKTGLGAATVVQGPDGPRVVMDTPINTVDVYANAPDVYYNSAGAVIPLMSSGGSQWISGIPNLAVGAAAAGVVLLLMGSMRR